MKFKDIPVNGQFYDYESGEEWRKVSETEAEMLTGGDAFTGVPEAFPAEDEVAAEAPTFEDHFKGQFMQPVIEEYDYYEVETDNGTEIIPADMVGNLEGLSKPGDELRAYDEVKVCPTDHDIESLTPRWTAALRALKDYVEGDDIQSIEFKHGFLARLSASGYMDCTDWSAHGTEQEAKDYLINTYGGD